MADRMLTVADLYEVHHDLNRRCFDGILPECTIAIGPSRYTKESIFGEYYPTGYGKGMILVDTRVADTDTKMRATVAHEMIHQWQDLLGMRLDHHSVFKGWCQHIHQLTGLTP